MSKQTEKTRTKLGAKIVDERRMTILLPLKNGSDDPHIERPYRMNLETCREREERLENRKELTLKVFKWAFDNNNSNA